MGCTFVTKTYFATGLTDVGLIRTHNEDTILIDSTLGLLIVADGMGGHFAGDVASQEAVQFFQQFIGLLHQPLIEEKRSLLKKRRSFFTRTRHDDFNQDSTEKKAQIEQLIIDVVKETNQHLYQMNISRYGQGEVGMGTTLAGCLLVEKDLMAIFHVGDSRVYRYSKGKLKQLTVDHSMLQGWKDAGGQGSKPKSNVIYKALGPFEDIQPDVSFINIDPGDVLMLCSDGLSDKVPVGQIKHILASVDVDSMESCAEQLRQKALNAGGQDNISLIIFLAQAA